MPSAPEQCLFLKISLWTQNHSAPAARRNVSLGEMNLTKFSLHVKKEGRWFHLQLLSTPHVARD